MRGNIVELLFACKYVHNSDDNNLGTVEHKATSHQSNNNDDVSRGDKELKDSLDGGMDVKGKMLCSSIFTTIDLSTLFDGIDDDYNVESGETKKLQGGYECVAKHTKMQIRTDIVQEVLRRPQVLVDEIEMTARKFTEENELAKQTKRQRSCASMNESDMLDMLHISRFCEAIKPLKSRF
ncbi:hypothetical protein Tco_0641426 [Tanacetum coccineum]